ncbi:bifunctional 2-polyprenyl-6-hydroxyphenol methylase/3-demethylubiquinol 3-O-methyltransferase UbiG [Phenylobacterium sp.]|uniref:class I SAM-dependent methyltransferase n=1 Tax=Phenylobacterium sp. TaxID=1871053 RepID=UPI0027313CB1|nr:class I SAM-dependent methyltransferase [Phenylobacterium sp.]MDP1619083.1 methyltransferase domain-containing protein [Phenylobacterium sp.]MDP1987023.1 methyltransferase domain-containing protein [Phenylobacterium sp.]
MAQNIYDDPQFFAGYSQLRRSVDGLAGAPEWPALQALLPSLKGARVVDLGCGFGWFCRWAAEAGAAEVLGLDLSARMLARAAELTDDGRITYRVADLETLDLPQGAFDCAFSSLALHYVEDLRPLFASVHDALAPGSRFVFSIEHPIYMAPRSPGWSLGVDGQRTWPVDSYQAEGPRRTNWLADGVVKHHRKLGTTLNLLIQAGFAIGHLDEFGPSPAQMAERPELAEERERPMFALVAAERL